MNADTCLQRVLYSSLSFSVNSRQRWPKIILRGCFETPEMDSTCSLQKRLKAVLNHTEEILSINQLEAHRPPVDENVNASVFPSELSIKFKQKKMSAKTVKT